MDVQPYFDTKDAAALLGVSASTLNKLRLSGKGPAYYKPEGLRRVLYKKDELIRWLEAGRRRSTSPTIGDATSGRVS
jgi:excisionase family DNA binding protein